MGRNLNGTYQMNWKQINSGLWKAEEGGYVVTAFRAIGKWHWCVTLNGFSVSNSHHLIGKGLKAKQAAEEAYNKLVK